MCVFVCLQECDQVHIDDVSSDDNGQDLRSDNTRSLCRAMLTSTQADLRGDKEVMPPKFAPPLNPPKFQDRLSGASTLCLRNDPGHL